MPDPTGPGDPSLAAPISAEAEAAPAAEATPAAAPAAEAATPPVVADSAATPAAEAAVPTPENRDAKLAEMEGVVDRFAMFAEENQRKACNKYKEPSLASKIFKTGLRLTIKAAAVTTVGVLSGGSMLVPAIAGAVASEAAHWGVTAAENKWSGEKKLQAELQGMDADKLVRAGELAVKAKESRNADHQTHIQDLANFFGYVGGEFQQVSAEETQKKAELKSKKFWWGALRVATTIIAGIAAGAVAEGTRAAIEAHIAHHGATIKGEGIGALAQRSESLQAMQHLGHNVHKVGEQWVFDYHINPSEFDKVVQVLKDSHSSAVLTNVGTDAAPMHTISEAVVDKFITDQINNAVAAAVLGIGVAEMVGGKPGLGIGKRDRLDDRAARAADGSAQALAYSVPPEAPAPVPGATPEAARLPEGLAAGAYVANEDVMLPDNPEPYVRRGEVVYLTDYDQASGQCLFSRVVDGKWTAERSSLDSGIFRAGFSLIAQPAAAESAPVEDDSQPEAHTGWNETQGIKETGSDAELMKVGDELEYKDGNDKTYKVRIKQIRSEKAETDPKTDDDKFVVKAKATNEYGQYTEKYITKTREEWKRVHTFALEKEMFLSEACQIILIDPSEEAQVNVDAKTDDKTYLKPGEKWNLKDNLNFKIVPTVRLVDENGKLSGEDTKMPEGYRGVCEIISVSDDQETVTFKRSESRLKRWSKSKYVTKDVTYQTTRNEFIQYFVSESATVERIKQAEAEEEARRVAEEVDGLGAGGDEEDDLDLRDRFNHEAGPASSEEIAKLLEVTGYSDRGSAGNSLDQFVIQAGVGIAESKPVYLKDDSGDLWVVKEIKSVSGKIDFRISQISIDSHTGTLFENITHTENKSADDLRGWTWYGKPEAKGAPADLPPFPALDSDTGKPKPEEKDEEAELLAKLEQEKGTVHAILYDKDSSGFRIMVDGKFSNTIFALDSELSNLPSPDMLDDDEQFSCTLDGVERTNLTPTLKIEIMTVKEIIPGTPEFGGWIKKGNAESIKRFIDQMPPAEKLADTSKDAIEAKKESLKDNHTGLFVRMDNLSVYEITGTVDINGEINYIGERKGGWFILDQSVFADHAIDWYKSKDAGTTAPATPQPGGSGTPTPETPKTPEQEVDDLYVAVKDKKFEFTNSNDWRNVEVTDGVTIGQKLDELVATMPGYVINPNWYYADGVEGSATIDNIYIGDNKIYISFDKDAKPDRSLVGEKGYKYGGKLDMPDKMSDSDWQKFVDASKSGNVLIRDWSGNYFVATGEVTPSPTGTGPYWTGFRFDIETGKKSAGPTIALAAIDWYVPSGTKGQEPPAPLPGGSDVSQPETTPTPEPQGEPDPKADIKAKQNEIWKRVEKMVDDEKIFTVGRDSETGTVTVPNSINGLYGQIKQIAPGSVIDGLQSLKRGETSLCHVKREISYDRNTGKFAVRFELLTETDRKPVELGYDVGGVIEPGVVSKAFENSASNRDHTQVVAMDKDGVFWEVKYYKEFSQFSVEAVDQTTLEVPKPESTMLENQNKFDSRNMVRWYSKTRTISASESEAATDAPVPAEPAAAPEAAPAPESSPAAAPAAPEAEDRARIEEVGDNYRLLYPDGRALDLTNGKELYEPGINTPMTIERITSATEPGKFAVLFTLGETLPGVPNPNSLEEMTTEELAKRFDDPRNFEGEK